MKKLLIITLVLALALSLAACGGSNNAPSGNNTQSASQGNNSSTSTPPSSTPDDTPNSDDGGETDTVAEYLAQFGLTEDDIKAEGFSSFEGPDGWLIKVNAGEGHANSWGKKIFDGIESISDDGKVYDQGYPTFKDEASWADGGTLYQWAYLYNGKVVEVDVTPPVDTPTLYRIALHFQ